MLRLWTKTRLWTKQLALNKYTMATVPYNTWSAFYDAVKCSLDMDEFVDEYPEYIEYMNESGSNEDIVNHLLSIGCDPQEGLDGFVDAVLFGSRYIMDCVKTCMKIFKDAGAQFDATKVFARTYDPSNATLEDEVKSNYYSKAILAMFTDPQVYVNNWTDIKPVYWEDIPDDTDFDTARLMHLRFVCDHFRDTYSW